MSDTEYRAEQIAAVAREMARLDLVNVVRCRDCRFYEPEGEKHISGCWEIPKPSWCRRLHVFKREPDGYCAWAERKEKGDTK